MLNQTLHVHIACVTQTIQSSDWLKYVTHGGSKSILTWESYHYALSRKMAQFKEHEDLTISVPGPVFIKHLKSNVYVTLNAIGSFLCNLCFHWLIQIFIT